MARWLAEESVQALTRCIRLNLDCSDVCGLLARMLSRQTEPELGLLRPDRSAERARRLLARVAARAGEEG